MRRLVLAATLVAAALQMLTVDVSALTADEAFDAVWRTTDEQVAAGGASYSWFWGPEVRGQRMEPYAESPNGEREVRYYDKSRMEINNPQGDPNTIYYVTNGLLTSELVTGRRQLGNATFDQRSPALVLVAGDPSGNPGTPSYAAFGPLATTDGQSNRSVDRTGQQVTAFLSGAGEQSETDAAGVTLASYQDLTGHNIAGVFWSWANDPSSGFRPEQGVDWLYVLGYPISEPYWIDSTVGGTPRRVLVQLFERRVLTYTSTNPQQYQVEFGNIGLHYHAWLYESSQLPAEVTQLYSWSTDDWETYDDGTGSAFVSGSSVHQRVEVPDAAVLSYLHEFDHPDLSASVRVRLVTPDTQLAEACLIVRLPETDLASDYALCLNGVGETVGFYEFADDLGASDYETLVPYDVRDALHAPTEWNTLKIVAKGTGIWFIVNDVLIGSVQHDSAPGGSAGFYVLNFDDTPCEYEWTDLTIFSVE